MIISPCLHATRALLIRPTYYLLECAWYSILHEQVHSTKGNRADQRFLLLSQLPCRHLRGASCPHLRHSALKFYPLSLSTTFPWEGDGVGPGREEKGPSSSSPTPKNRVSLSFFSDRKGGGGGRKYFMEEEEEGWLPLGDGESYLLPFLLPRSAMTGYPNVIYKRASTSFLPPFPPRSSWLCVLRLPQI